MLFVAASSLLATGDVPLEILEGFPRRCRSWMVRGIVVGDIVRRLVARTMAKQVAKQAEKAPALFQYAFSATGGCECIIHIVQSLTDVDSNGTVVSIDGVGACDLISRNSMLRGLLRMENGDQILPFVRCFYGRPSTYLSEDVRTHLDDVGQSPGGGDRRLFASTAWSAIGHRHRRRFSTRQSCRPQQFSFVGSQTKEGEDLEFVGEAG